ncbi:hypothetical protein UPYG_G00145370 [Umbra pygmaea]|uniref:Uncharacterized protein n=1 Tax=Umbra pygmaea TaxID=75934 RepID=A0ABD0WW59_UMBPY
MLRYIQGGTCGQEEDADDEQPSTSSSGTHQPPPACRPLDTRVPSLDQPPSISSIGTDTEQRTTTSESTSPVVESPSAGWSPYLSRGPSLRPLLCPLSSKSRPHTDRAGPIKTVSRWDRVRSPGTRLLQSVGHPEPVKQFLTR